MAFSIYVSHSTSPWELAHVYTLADEAARRGLDIYVPDRTWDPSDLLPERISARLSQTDAVLLLATLGGYHSDWVNLEVSAMPQNRPLIALAELGVTLHGIAPENVVWFNRADIAGTMEVALRRLQSLKSTKETTNLLAGFLIGTLALFVLREVTKK